MPNSERPTSNGYNFHSKEAAISAAIEIALKSTNHILVVADIDDTLLRSYKIYLDEINTKVIELLNPDFIPISEEDLMAAEGRFSKVEKLKQVLKDNHIEYYDFVAPIFTDHVLHESMEPLDGAGDLISLLGRFGVSIVYLTARPEEMGAPTAHSLARHHFPEAPIIHSGRNHVTPEKEKGEVITQIIAALPDDYKVIMLDDYVKTIKELNRKQYKSKVIPICVTNKQNEASTEMLRECQISFGRLSDITTFLEGVFVQTLSN